MYIFGPNVLSIYFDDIIIYGADEAEHDKEIKSVSEKDLHLICSLLKN